MTGRYRTVGLGGISEEEFSDMMGDHLVGSRFFDANGENYLRISMGSSLVYWVAFCRKYGHLSAVDEDIHFHSKQRSMIHYCKVLEFDDSMHMMGLVRIHLLLKEIGKDIPLNVNVPMLRVTEMLEYGNGYYAQIAGYAEAAKCWPNAEAYEASFPDAHHLAVEHVIPTGTFSQDGDKQNEQSSRALLGGRISTVERCTNSFTSKDYWHVTITAFGDVFDLLIAPDDLDEEPVVGGVLHGSFWLSAMLYRNSDDEDFCDRKEYTEEYGEDHDTPEEEQDSAGCQMWVTRPISDRILQRIADILASLEKLPGDFLTVLFTGRSDREFIQAAYSSHGENKTYLVEYSCFEDERQIIRTKRYLTLEQTVAVFAEACRKMPEEFDFTGWLDNGYEPQEDDDFQSFEHYRADGCRDMRHERQLALSCEHDFQEDNSEEEELYTDTFRMVIEEDEKLTETERESLQAIVFDTASMLYACNVQVDGMQVGFRNDPEGELLWQRDETHEGWYHISLCVDTLDDWSQLIYQLGYVLSHCILDFTAGEARGIPWMNETICEMMQIWLLSSFASNWNESRLYKKDEDYDEHLQEYLGKYMTDQEWTDRPSQCTSMKELLTMNQRAEDHSDERVGTVIHLYYLTMPGDLNGLMDYAFLGLGEQSGLINTKEWTSIYPDNLAVRYLASIQDHAVRNDEVFEELLIQNGEDPDEYWKRFDEDNCIDDE